MHIPSRAVLLKSHDDGHRVVRLWELRRGYQTGEEGWFVAPGRWVEIVDDGKETCLRFAGNSLHRAERYYQEHADYDAAVKGD